MSRDYSKVQDQERKKNKFDPSVWAWSFLPWPLVPLAASSLCSHSSQLPFLLSSTLPLGPQMFLSSQRDKGLLAWVSVLVSLVRTIFPRFPFCEFFLSFEAHSRSSSSAAKALCAIECSTWPCDIWGLVFTAFKTAFLCRLPSCTMTRTIPWFFLFFCIFFLFSRLAFHFLAHCLAHWKCLLNFVWWIMNELMA